LIPNWTNWAATSKIFVLKQKTNLELLMISISAPQGIRKVADRFKDIFNGNFNCLCALLCLHIFGLKGFSDAARFFGWSQSTSSLNDAANKFSKNRFMRRLRASILRKWGKELNDKDFAYAIDDTINPKYGKNIFGNDYWGTSNRRIIQGQKIIVLVLVNKKTGYALPIHYFFCLKKDKKEYQSGHNLALQMLRDVLKEGFPKLPVAFDSWFSSADLMKKLNKLGFKFCMQSKENRVVKTKLGKFSKWSTWEKIFSRRKKEKIKIVKKNKKRSVKIKFASSCRVHFRKLSLPLKAIAVYNRKTDKKHFAIYVTNDLDMTNDFLFDLSRKRWHQEELFRNLKQNLSFGELACTSEEGANLSVCLPFALIVSLQLFPHEWNHESMSSLTIGTMIEKIRAENFNKSLHVLVHNPKHPSIHILKSRRHVSRIHKKPVNSIVVEGWFDKNLGNSTADEKMARVI